MPISNIYIEPTDEFKQYIKTPSGCKFKFVGLSTFLPNTFEWEETTECEEPYGGSESAESGGEGFSVPT